MTADSAVTLELGESREYEVGRKSYFYPGVGCVTTWGARDHNRIGPFLDECHIAPDTHDVASLADLVQRYLTEQYRPDELDLDDVGYHVAGFDRDHQPRLWHIFYGFDRPRPEAQKARKYERYEHTPPAGAAYFLYNGRNDLAHFLVQTILNEIRSSREVKFDLRSPVDLALFSDFVARFAAEITPQVGPPFITYVISSNNQALTVVNHLTSSPGRDAILSALRGIGYDGP
jgi:hypothetical protein